MVLLFLDLRKHQLQSSEVSSSEEKQRLLRPLFLTWHPDKRPEQVELATQVFQWLQAGCRCLALGFELQKL